jgi:phosphoribosylaminoimidazolecarboxamide formyltransferase/IMP cyclohydrolase
MEVEALQQANKRALISVSDKTGLIDFARSLVELGYHLVSTGGTARSLAEAEVPVEPVEELTGFPEILGGRVKTLHPKVHAGILARDLPEDRAQLEQLGIETFDLVAVNLYPFRQTVAQPNIELQQAIEQIDIGGPSMVRAAAKNFARVAVVVNPDNYAEIIAELRSSGAIPLAARFRLAREAFWHTALYDAAIAGYLFQADVEQPADLQQVPEQDQLPPRLSLPLIRVSPLRYGENPHQSASFYRDGDLAPYGLAAAVQHQGKELSYNNLLDLDAALRVVAEQTDPAAVVIKHSTPSGVACDPVLSEAYRKAREANALAAFGGIVGLNRPVDRETAEALAETFLEAVAAPGYSEEALQILHPKKNLRLLSVNLDDVRRGGLAVKRVTGGYLLQDLDLSLDELRQLRSEARVVTNKAPTDEQWADLTFAWAVIKHVSSNGIVLARRQETIGIGGGQVSRVDAAGIALSQAGDKARGSVLASDGFFPFPDSVENAANAGVAAMIQPGGSVNDDQVIAAANAHGMVMVFTGRRHFKH